MSRRQETGDGHAQSRLPVQKNRGTGGRGHQVQDQQPFVRHNSQENGVTSPQRKSARKYETFVMTGDMIIHTTSERNQPQGDVKQPSKKSTAKHGDGGDVTSAKKKKVEQGPKSKLPKLNTSASPRLPVKTDVSKPPPHGNVKASPKIAQKAVTNSPKSSPQIKPKSGIPSPKSSPKRKPVQHSPQSSPNVLRKTSTSVVQHSPSLIPKASAGQHHSPSLIPKSNLPKPSPKVFPKSKTHKVTNLDSSSDMELESPAQPKILTDLDIGLVMQSEMLTDLGPGSRVTKPSDNQGQDALTRDEIVAETPSNSSHIERVSKENISGHGIGSVIIDEAKINELGCKGGVSQQVNPSKGHSQELCKPQTVTQAITEQSVLNTNISQAPNTSSDVVIAAEGLANGCKSNTRCDIGLNQHINTVHQALISHSNQQPIQTEWLHNYTDNLLETPPPSPPPPPLSPPPPPPETDTQDGYGISPFDERPRPVYHACQAMPITLDIPPDDICSEDELLGRMDYTSFDMDDLPPPPEELLRSNYEDFVQHHAQLAHMPHIMGLANYGDDFDRNFGYQATQENNTDSHIVLTNENAVLAGADDRSCVAINNSSPKSGGSDLKQSVDCVTPAIEPGHTESVTSNGDRFEIVDNEPSEKVTGEIKTDLAPISAIKRQRHRKSEFDDSFYSQDSDIGCEDSIERERKTKMTAPLVLKNTPVPAATSQIPRPSVMPASLNNSKCINNKSGKDSDGSNKSELSGTEADAHEVYFEELLESPPYSHAMDNSFTLGMLSANTSMDTSFTIVENKANTQLKNLQRAVVSSQIPKVSAQSANNSVNVSQQNAQLKSPPHSAPPVVESQESADSKDASQKKKRGMVTSKSAEKITPKNRAAPNQSGHSASPMCVRNSKSQENYLDNEGITLIDIDFEDNIASSVDALHYDKSTNSLDHMDNYSAPSSAKNYTADRSQSLENSPERRYEKLSDKIHMPTFFSINEPHSINNKPSTTDAVTKLSNIRNRSTSDSSYAYKAHAQIERGSGEPSPVHKVTPIVKGQNVTVYPVVNETESVWIVKETNAAKTELNENKRNNQTEVVAVSQSPSKQKSPKDKKSSKHKAKGQSPKHKRKPNPAESTSTQATQESHSTQEQKKAKASKSRTEQKIPQSDIFYQHNKTNDRRSVESSTGAQKTPPGVNNNEQRTPASDKSATQFELQELNSSPLSPRKRLQSSDSPKRTQPGVAMAPANDDTSCIVNNTSLSSQSNHVDSPSHEAIHIVSNGTNKQSVVTMETDRQLVETNLDDLRGHTVPHNTSPGCTISVAKSSDKSDTKKQGAKSPKHKGLSLDTKITSSPQTVQNEHFVTSSLDSSSQLGQSSSDVVSASSPHSQHGISKSQDSSLVNSSTPRSADSKHSPTRQQPNSKAMHSPTKSSKPQSPTQDLAGKVIESPPSPEYDADSIYHQPLKDVDVPSAKRLAKRLFHLEGFKKSDISKHLSKKNDFAQQVGEEFLSYFDFSNMTLDEAIRSFLLRITLAGETQERERVLVHFSRRYMQCNPGSYNSEDACHTLLCAILLLNTDLHGQNVGRKMTVEDFIENLSDLNDGENFPREVLKNLYQSIKTNPLEMEFDEDSDTGGADFDLLQTGVGNMLSRAPPPDQQRYVGHNPFLEIPDPSKGTEYKKGFVMRKCCMEPDGRKTPVGKRGWKMFYAVLKDMVLYLHKDEHAYKKNAIFDNMSNSIRIHHSLTVKAVDYKKKQHVLRLTTADWAEYLFQTGNPEECQKWIDALNTVSATLSAPPLPSAVGSQKRFQKPLLPASFTRYNAREQLQHHEQRVSVVERELHDHRKYPPEKGAKARVIHEYIEKEHYLQHELQRYEAYSLCLRSPTKQDGCRTEPMPRRKIPSSQTPPFSRQISANQSVAGSRRKDPVVPLAWRKIDEPIGEPSDSTAKRFKTYCFLLQSKIASFSELEPSLVETAICEVSEPPSPSTEHKESPLSKTSPVEARKSPDRRVHRSMSDRSKHRSLPESVFTRYRIDDPAFYETAV